jgi:hypothetical protein
MKTTRAMSSNIKLLTLTVFLICSLAANAQEENNGQTENEKAKNVKIIDDETGNNLEHDDHYGIFEIGPYLPIAIGDNFTKKYIKMMYFFDCHLK